MTRKFRWGGLAGLLLVVAAMFSAAAPAAQADDLEGIWSFSGGAVGIQGLSDGSYQGTVVSPTTFAFCTHPVDQTMWTNIRPTNGGYFLGWHQWYRGENCEVVPRLGRIAIRLFDEDDGSKILLACFTEPSSSAIPSIDADGKVAGATACAKSSLLAQLPGSPGSPIDLSFDNLVSLPPATTACRRRLAIVLRNPKFDPLKQVVVSIDGKVVVRVKGFKGSKKRIIVDTMSERSRYSVRVSVTTVLGHHRSKKRIFRNCGKGKVRFTH